MRDRSEMAVGARLSAAGLDHSHLVNGILETQRGGLLDVGTVEFIARYQRNSQAGAFQELSRFGA